MAGLAAVASSASGEGLEETAGVGGEFGEGGGEVGGVGACAEGSGAGAAGDDEGDAAGGGIRMSG